MMNTLARRTRLLYTVATALLIAACGGGGDGPPVTGGGPGQPQAGTPVYTLAVDPHPLTASVATDDTRSVSQDITPDGGSLVATGADGTVYTLSVPPDALAESTHITMAPVTRLQGTPFGEQARGVQLGPEGLHFSVPAELRVTPPTAQAWPVAQQVPVAVRGDGVVSLAALSPGSTEPVFELMHFSSYALLLATQGMDASLEAVRHRLGGDAEARLESAAAETLARLRQTQQAVPPSGDLASTMSTLFDAYEAQVLKPRIAAAGSSCAAGRLAIQTALSFERQRELLGMAAQTLQEVLGSLIDTASSTCIKEEFQICRDQHIITRMVPAMLAITRDYALMGLQAPADVNLYAEKCLRFELVLDSSAQYVELAEFQQNPHTMNETVHADIDIRYRSMFGPGQTPRITASALLIQGLPTALVSRSYRVVSQDPCNTVSQLQPLGGQFGTSMLDWLAAAGSVSQRAEVQDFRLMLMPYPDTSTMSNYQLVARTRDAQGGCNDPTTSTYGDDWVTAASPLLLSLEEAATTDGLGPAIVGWTLGSGERLATKQIDLGSSDSTGSTRLQVTLALYHRPASE